MPREIIFNQEEVLDKVIDLFWKKGYSSTSMQDLTMVTGLNRSSIYNTFGSKMELYKRALKKYQKQSGGLFQNALLQSTNSKEAIHIIFKYLVLDILEDTDSKGCFNMNCKAEMSQKNTSIKNWLEQTQENSIGFFEGLVDEAQQSKLINQDKTAHQYAHYLFSAFQGLRMTGILIKDKAILQSIADNTLKILD